MPKVNEPEDVWARVVKGEGPDDCWAWSGTHSGEGYGHMTIRYRQSLVHRIIYELVVGPLKPGLVVDHLCANPGCCNPAHLEQVTQRENVLRGRGVTAAHAAKTHCVNGHEFTPENTYEWKGRPGRACRSCARQRTTEWRARRRAEVEKT